MVNFRKFDGYWYFQRFIDDWAGPWQGRWKTRKAAQDAAARLGR